MLHVLGLLVIADDLTGALDASVQLAHKGYRVAVSCDRNISLDEVGDYDVLAIDTESRHMEPADAYSVVFDIANRARLAHVSHVYKKCDSGLRGNVGAELAAVLDGLQVQRLNFVPAYPELHRQTKNGIQYVDGMPLAQSIFAQDPIDAVTVSGVADVIAQTSGVEAHMSGDANASGIVIFDCASQDELESIGRDLTHGNGFDVAAGCAGLLSVYPERKAGPQIYGTRPELLSPLVVVSGSLNAVTRGQLDYAQQAGFARRHLPLDRVLEDAWAESDAAAFVDESLSYLGDFPGLLIDSIGSDGTKEWGRHKDAPCLIADAMGLLAAMCERRLPGTLMVVGGDTLVAFFKHRDISLLEPVEEMLPGVVLTRYSKDGRWHYVITKSGGFGSPDTFCQIRKGLQGKEEEHYGIG